MTRSFIILFLAISLYVLFSCRHISQEAHSSPFPISFTQQPKTAITGTWVYSFPFYSSELTLQENGKFTFYERGCTGQGYSEGNWSINDETLILKSSEKFRKQVEAIINYTHKSSTKQKTRVTNTKAGMYQVTIDPSLFETNASFIWPDTSNVFFDNVKIRITVDTLFELDKRGILTTAKYYKFKHSH